jgi:hypothetical protein
MGIMALPSAGGYSLPLHSRPGAFACVCSGESGGKGPDVTRPCVRALGAQRSHRIWAAMVEALYVKEVEGEQEEGCVKPARSPGRLAWVMRP